MISYDDKKFSSLINTMGFSKSTTTNKDFIVINPPYKSGLHIKIFNKSFEELNDGGTLICLHPSTPFINRKPTRDTFEIEKIKKIISKYKSKLTLINGNDIFNANFFTPLSITRVEKVLDEKIEVVYSHIDSKNTKINTYKNIDDIFVHGNDIVIQIKNKIFNKISSTIEDNLYRKGSRGNYYLTINRISGNKPKDGKLNPDFFQLIYKQNELNSSDIISTTPLKTRLDGNQINELALDDEKSVINAHSYLLTKFARFCNSLYKTGPDILAELKAVPYMNFTQEWTDEKLFDYFELTQEERNFGKGVGCRPLSRRATI